VGALVRRRPALILLAVIYVGVPIATARTPATVVLGVVIVAYVAVQLRLAAQHVRRDRVQ
jgi:hypothetical protein